MTQGTINHQTSDMPSHTMVDRGHSETKLVMGQSIKQAMKITYSKTKEKRAVQNLAPNARRTVKKMIVKTKQQQQQEQKQHYSSPAR